MNFQLSRCSICLSCLETMMECERDIDHPEPPLILVDYDALGIPLQVRIMCNDKQGARYEARGIQPRYQQSPKD